MLYANAKVLCRGGNNRKREQEKQSRSSSRRIGLVARYVLNGGRGRSYRRGLNVRLSGFFHHGVLLDGGVGDRVDRVDRVAKEI